MIHTGKGLLLLLLASGLLASGLLAGGADAALRNRYSFDAGAADSVGGQNGVLFGTNGSFSGGQLVLANTGELSGNGGAAGAYLDLPNGLISGAAATGVAGAVTVEMWVTVQQNRPWAAAFTAGTNPGGEGASGGNADSPYIQVIPFSGDGGQGNDFRVTTNSYAGGEGYIDDQSELAMGVKEHLVTVFDQSGGLPGNLIVYRNGIRVPPISGVGLGGAIAPNLNLTSFLNPDATGGDVNNWLGRSQFGDPLLSASYDDVRVYSHALSPQEALAGAVFGPNVVGASAVPSIEVNKTTGEITLKNNAPAPLSLEYYRITSGSGALLTDSWNSLDNQNYNAVDGVDAGATAGDSDGEGWDASDAVDSHQLIELFLADGGSVLAANQTLSLGTAYNTSLFGANDGDLAFQFGTAGGSLFDAPVEYLVAPTLVGDYNNDNVVDAADYTVWRDSLGQSGTGLAADGNQSGAIDSGDYDLWRMHFGQSAGPLAGQTAALLQPTAAPEPAGLVLAVLALLPLVARSPRGRPSLNAQPFTA